VFDHWISMRLWMMRLWQVLAVIACVVEVEALAGGSIVLKQRLWMVADWWIGMSLHVTRQWQVAVAACASFRGLLQRVPMGGVQLLECSCFAVAFCLALALLLSVMEACEEVFVCLWLVKKHLFLLR
jgi:hypothetical protein